MSELGSREPLVVHVVHRFDYGGLENGLVNLVNRLPPDRYRHAIVSMTEIGGIARRIDRVDVELIELRRSPGPLLRETPRLVRLFRRLRPAIVHTRNVGTLEAQIAAALAGVRSRVHGEHGWEIHDLGEGHPGLLRTRRWMRHWVHVQIALSTPTRRYLAERVGVDDRRLMQIANGVDTDRFKPPDPSGRQPLRNAPSWPIDAVVVGTVGRLQDVKNPLALVHAVASLLSRRPELASRLRLALIGDGPLSDAVSVAVRQTGLEQLAWLPGARDDVADVHRAIDVFVLPSLAEGLCNALLESMACGRPAVATDVGGNPEIVESGITGTIVPSADVEGLARAIERYVDDPALRGQHGEAGRRRVIERFSMQQMISGYDALYRDLVVSRAPSQLS